ncbi:hypothetical protein OROGR_000427 [Orobanche gracilis]
MNKYWHIVCYHSPMYDVYYPLHSVNCLDKPLTSNIFSNASRNSAGKVTKSFRIDYVLANRDVIENGVTQIRYDMNENV